MSNEHERVALESRKAAGRILVTAKTDMAPQEFVGAAAEIGPDAETVGMLVQLAAGGTVRG
jgi:hypothetical protein